MNPINIHRWHVHNRIQKSVMVSKHIVLRSYKETALCPYCLGVANSHRFPYSTLNESSIKFRARGTSRPAICSAVLQVQWSPS